MASSEDMLLRHDPPHPKRPLDTLTDEELSRLEKATILVKGAYIPATPQNLIQAVVDAEAMAALPLVLPIHRKVQMNKRKETL